jgi:ZIP family zinc transporter
VLLYVSFVEIFAKARASLSPLLGPGQGYALSVLAFFGGIALIALVDHWLPVHALLPTTLENSRTTPPTEDRRLWRLGLVSAIAIAIHNFPEGLATFLGGLSNPRLGISIAIAIAIHNIPEGLAIAAPVVAATGNRRLAFLLFPRDHVRLRSELLQDLPNPEPYGTDVVCCASFTDLLKVSAASP